MKTLNVPKKKEKIMFCRFSLKDYQAITSLAAKHEVSLSFIIRELVRESLYGK